MVSPARVILLIAMLLGGGLSVLPASAAPGQPAAGAAEATLAMMANVNAALQASGTGIAVTAIDFYTIGEARPSVRIHQQPFRWVPGDPRRQADGDNLTYLIDESDGATTSGLTTAQTTAEIVASFNTWDADTCLAKVDIVRRADPGTDPDIFDSFYGYGGFGNPFLADIVSAGWLPRAYFEAVGGPGGGRGILAFSVTFVFTDADGNPTDINGDNYIDTALNEVYYNDTFGDPANDRAGNPWAINMPAPAIDVQTVALHENGHSLGIGHFGPPPAALMNPRYDGVRWVPTAADSAGMCANYRSWPNP